VRPETTTELGRRAEERALEYLCAQGLEPLDRNYRCRGGEIDLVMLQGATLVLVEVRSRASGKYGSAAESIDGRKRRRIVRAARHLLLMRPDLAKLRARFDVVTIDGEDQQARLNWICNAFSVTG
jgi:putative endonuclease